MGRWSDATKEMVRPQTVLGYPEPDEERRRPAPVKKAPVKKTPATRAPAKKGPVTRAPAKKAPGKAPSAGKVTAAKSSATAARSGSTAARSGAKAGGKATAVRSGAPRSSRLPMDPRIKERWVSVRREQGHRRLRAALAGAVVVAVLAGCVGVAFSPFLAVRHVRVAATAHVGVPQVLAVTGLGDHRPMVELNAAGAVSRLEHLPWVASARVSRQWPTTVAVTIRERRPIAQVPVAGGVVEVDGTGRVLTSPQAATVGLPTLVGAPAPGTPGTWLAGTGGASPPQGNVGTSLAVASALPAPVAARVTTVTVDAHGVVSLALTPGPTTVTLGEVAAPGDPASGSAVTGSSVPVALARQVAALATLLSTVDLSKVAQIDLTVPDRPALTPAHTPTTLSTTSRG